MRGNDIPEGRAAKGDRSAKSQENGVLDTGRNGKRSCRCVAETYVVVEKGNFR